MKKWKKYGAFMFAMVMCLSFAACGSSDSIAASSEETENAEGDSEELVTDAASLDGMWSINGGTKLYFDSEGGYYIYRSYYGVGGRGEMSESTEDGKPMMTFNGFMYDFVLRSDGVLMPNQNGDGDGLNIHRNTFKRDDTAKLAEWEANNWDGMWQNAVGETIVIDTANMMNRDTVGICTTAGMRPTMSIMSDAAISCLISVCCGEITKSSMGRLFSEIM